MHNGHRHSYASYRLTETGDPARVAWEMNTSERKLKDNYLSLVNEKQLALWKKVLPKPGTKQKENLVAKPKKHLERVFKSPQRKSRRSEASN